jgi:hypothetical protein
MKQSLIIALLGLQGLAVAQKDSVRQSAQFPSPMVDTVRKHERIQQRVFKGVNFTLQSVLPKPVEVFIPDRSAEAKECVLLIHFLGANYVVQYAAEQFKGDIVTAFVHLGAGSKINGQAFEDSTRFTTLLDSIRLTSRTYLNHELKIGKVILSGFSAGYGAVRQILSTLANYDRVDAVLLLDGIHASYVPDRKLIADGGRIDSTHIESFLKLAQDASRPDSRKQFLVTHSEIFPGTYASTTETTDYILQKLNCKREPLLEWGPLGMQQLSSARRNHFKVMGFAGNTAQDHVDHVQALYHFFGLLMAL